MADLISLANISRNALYPLAMIGYQNKQQQQLKF